MAHPFLGITGNASPLCTPEVVPLILLSPWPVPSAYVACLLGIPGPVPPGRPEAYGSAALELPPNSVL